MSEVNSSKRQRQQRFFEVYYILGPKRSLSLLLRTVHRLGTRISLNTLKRYSSDFKWVSRVREMDMARQEERDVGLRDEIRVMDEDHVRLGKDMQVLGNRKFDALGQQSSDVLEVSDAIKIVKTGVEIERLARGVPTKRKELVSYVWNVAIKDIVTLFLEVNVIKDEKERLVRWTEGADRIVESRLREAGVE